jgi:drug/metabolite transporter (DMT)-like permease
MLSSKLRSDLVLLLAAMIWGFAFVAQRIGMDYVGPFTYNGVRFALGTLVLVPFLLFRKETAGPLITVSHPADRRRIIMGSFITGLFLFAGVSLQQYGLQFTTAGKAGFITGLYVVFVTIAGIFFGHRSNVYIWIGIALSLAGLYFLSITKDFTIVAGDMYVLGCAVAFTGHVLMIAWLSPQMDSIFLAIIQFTICSVLNLLVASAVETIEWNSILAAWLPILYGGALSVGIAYTLQVVAQKTAHPAYASIILSLEAVFAVIGGIIILHEVLTGRILTGCLLMLSGMVLVQLKGSH